jgi:hypothetical protein
MTLDSFLVFGKHNLCCGARRLQTLLVLICTKHLVIMVSGLFSDDTALKLKEVFEWGSIFGYFRQLF